VEYNTERISVNANLGAGIQFVIDKLQSKTSIELSLYTNRRTGRNTVKSKRPVQEVYWRSLIVFYACMSLPLSLW
jgi:hypothetical protein